MCIVYKANMTQHHIKLAATNNTHWNVTHTRIQTGQSAAKDQLQLAMNAANNPNSKIQMHAVGP